MQPGVKWLPEGSLVTVEMANRDPDSPNTVVTDYYQVIDPTHCHYVMSLSGKAGSVTSPHPSPSLSWRTTHPRKHAHNTLRVCTLLANLCVPLKRNVAVYKG